MEKTIIKRFSIQRSLLKKTLLKLGALLIILILFCYAIDSVSNSRHSQEIQILDKAVSKNITQCYAMEGSYPPNMDYLIQKYYLRYDQKKYFIDYEFIADNIRPNYTIIQRKDSK